MSIELALHPACVPEGILNVIHTESCVLQTVAQKCIYGSRSLWPWLNPSKHPVQQPFCQHSTRQVSDTNQVPHSGPTIVSRHCSKFNRPDHLARCIYVPLVSAWRVGQVCDVISCSLIAALRTPSRYVVILLLFSESQPRQPTGLS